MLKITVELVSAIHPSRSKILGVATIANDASGTHEAGNYRVTLSKWAPMENQVWKAGAVTGFDRKKRGAWDLLFMALRNTVGRRNP